MKKAIVLGTVAALSFAAHAEMKAPTISGRLNNELRYVTQSDGAGEPAEGYATYTGIADVSNAPSYLRASGNIPMNEMLNLDYVVEMGVRVDVNGVDLRQSAVMLNSPFGTLVAGHTYTPVSKISSFDLLGATGAGLGGSDFGEIANIKLNQTGYTSTVEGIGYRHTLRKDVIGYKSPKMMGFQLYATQDRNNDENLDKQSTGDNGTYSTSDDPKAHSPNRYDIALNYDNAFGAIKVKGMLGYLMMDGGQAYGETQMTAAGKVSWMGLDFSLGYVATSWEKNSKDIDNTTMFGGLGYTYNAHNIAFTYGMKEFEDKESVTKTEASQMSLGYQYAFNKNVTGTLTGSMITIEDKTSVSPDKKNDATQLATGLRVTF